MDSLRQVQYEKLQKQIGNTDVIEIHRTMRNNRIFAKLEYQNPTGSHHDRQYVPLLLDLEMRGEIIPGESILIDVTSGNAGASLAWVGREMGYSVRVIVPSELPVARVEDISRFGAEVIVSDGDYVLGSIQKLKDILAHHPEYKCINHSRRPLAADCLRAIAVEALQQVPSLQVFVGVVGSGSSLLGMTPYLHEHHVKVLAWEPFGSAHGFDLQQPGEYQIRFGIPPGTVKHQIYGGSFVGVTFPHITQSVPLLDGEILLIADTDQLTQYQSKMNLTLNLPMWDRVDCSWEVGRTSRGSLAAVDKIEKGFENTDFLIIFYDPSWKY